jgi:hypothetical protein
VFGANYNYDITDFFKFYISTEKLHHLVQPEQTAKKESDAEGK